MMSLPTPRASWRHAGLASALVALACFAAAPRPVFGGIANVGAKAWLTWSPTTVVSDLSVPGALTNLYIRVENADSYKGAEFDLNWTPAGDGDACAAHIGTLLRTSTDCTYLNRGTAVPVITADDPGHFHIAWSNTETNTACTAGGNIIAVQFAFDGCTDARGCFTVHGLKLLDAVNAQDDVELTGATATVLGGAEFCASNNRAPVLSAIGPQSVGEGSTLSFSVYATDDDSDALTYAAAPLPPGATFSIRSFFWTPGAGYAGEYPILFAVSDPSGASDDESVTVTVTAAGVNHAPQFTAAPDQASVETRSLSFAVFASDPDYDVLTYTVDGVLPAGASFAGQTFAWTPSVGQAGSYVVAFRVSDPAGATDTMSVAVRIGPVGTPNDGVRGWLSWSSTGVQGNLAHAEGLERLYVRLDGTGSFAGGEADLTWLPSSAGDSCFAHVGTNFKAAPSCDFLNRGITTPLVTVDDPNHFHVQWTNSYANTVCGGGNALMLYFQFDGCPDPQGCFTLDSLSVTDALGQVVAVDVQGPTALVQNGSALCGISDQPPIVYPIPDKTIAEDSLLTFTVTALDPEGDSLTYSALGLPQGASFTQQTFAWTPTMGQSASEYDVTFFATDPAGLSGSDVVHITVTPSPGQVYVDQESPCTTCDGRAWTTAFHTIAEALPQARSGVGDSVLVAEGTFAEVGLSPSASTVLSGGYPHGGGAPSFSDHPTILSPSVTQTITPVLILDASGITAQSLRITGIRQGVLAVQILGAHSTLRGVSVLQNLFKGNPAVRFEPTATGALLDHCIISKNISNSPLGSVYIAAGADVALLSTVVAFDTIRAVTGSPGVACDGAMTATNSVFWGLHPLFLTPIKVGSAAVVTVDYCGVQAGWPGTGNLSSGPQFCDPPHGNYSLKSTSPYIGAGEDGSDIGCLGVGCNGAPPKNPDIPRQAPAATPRVTTFRGVTPRVAGRMVTLHYDLAQGEHVRAELFNALGARVAVWIDRAQPAGVYSPQVPLVDAAGARVAAGLYAVRFHAGAVEQVERVVVIR